MCGIADSAVDDRASRRGDSISGSPPVRMTSRIAGRCGEPVVCRLQFGFGQQAAVRADVLAAEAEAAINRADQQWLQQRAVGIAMHHALDRRQLVIRDRIGSFVRCGDEFGRIRHELASDRVVRPLDQPVHRRGDCDGITLLHGHQGAARLGQDQARGNKSVGVAQGPLAGERLNGHGGRA